MKKYSFHLVTVIFLITGIASCKKETNTPVIPPPAEVNQPPIARAGADSTFTLSSCGAKVFLPLDGTKSSDPENDITSSAWRIISGPPEYVTITSGNTLYATLEISRKGIYSFELSIVDKGKLTSKDTVTITVIGPSPNGYDFDISINTTYTFRDIVVGDCGFGPCDYYDYTLIDGTGNFLPFGAFNISLNEYTDSETRLETSNLTIANNVINTISGRTSVNLKKLIQGGGGAFNGNFTVTQGSAIKCDANIYNTLAPLLVIGNLDTTTKKVSITIKGKTFF